MVNSNLGSTECVEGVSEILWEAIKIKPDGKTLGDSLVSFVFMPNGLEFVQAEVRKHSGV
jgi:hypothetical protein